MATADDARRELARRELARRRGEQEAQPEGRGMFRRVDDAVRGMADLLTLGMSDEISAGLGSLTGIGGQRGDYEGNVAQQRQRDQDGGWERVAGQLGGGVLGGVGLARAGLSLGANAATAGRGLGSVARGSAADGAILGMLHGAGSGEDLESRAQGAALGSALGAGTGLVAPYAVAGATAAGRAVAAPIMSRLRPGDYAGAALNDGLRRSGMSVDDVVGSLSRAQADDQGMFAVADAMGNSGQRMLSTVARTPNNMRQTVMDNLTQRQMGQGERLSQALSRGFNAPDTAAQRQASLQADRSMLANVNYANARSDARPVNLTGAINKIDDLLGRDPILGESALSRGPLGTRLKALRAQIENKGEQLVDFDRVIALKSDMFQQMKRNPDVASDLRPVYEMLDSALERASPAYRAANDAYRSQSRTIDAVDTGRQAASSRTRAADSMQTFRGMEPGEQMAFRAGYVDPIIGRIESSSIAPTTNRARMLMTDKSGQEFPAFAIPQRADRMGRQIAREQRMFETANAAMGGSRTADNLADAAEMSKFDPGVMVNLFRRPISAAVDAVTRLANEARGMPPQVMDEIAKVLLETNPAAARQVLSSASARGAAQDGRRALANAIMVNMGAAGGARAATPSADQGVLGGLGGFGGARSPLLP